MMKLVPEARQAHRLWSVQASTVTTLLIVAEFATQALPLWQGIIPDGAFALAGAITSTAAIGLRLIQQRLNHE